MTTIVYFKNIISNDADDDYYLNDYCYYFFYHIINLRKLIDRKRNLNLNTHIHSCCYVQHVDKYTYKDRQERRVADS
jgi:hypothetical protein